MSEPTTDVMFGQFNIPGEARNRIYEVVLKLPHPIFLFQDGHTRVEAFALGRPRNWLALLYNSRRMHEEAAAVLYGMNTFVLLDTGMGGPELIHAFLNMIGDGHANMLSHLCITFPPIHRTFGGFEPSADGVKAFEQLRTKCSKLEVLEAHLVGQPAIDLTDVDCCMPEFMPDALTHLDSHVKSLPSMQRFIVRMYSGRPAARYMEVMQDFGWEVLPANRDRW